MTYKVKVKFDNDYELEYEVNSHSIGSTNGVLILTLKDNKKVVINAQHWKAFYFG